MADVKVPEINSVTISGRLTADPDEKALPSGVDLAKFTVACGRRFKKDDKWLEETTFLECTQFGKGAASTGARFRKGDPVVVEGSLRQESWEKDGQKRSRIVCIVFKVHALTWPEKSGDIETDARQREHASSEGLPF